MPAQHLAAALTVAALLVGACSGSGDDPEAGPSAATSASRTDQARADVVEEIADLPAVDLQDLDAPDAPEGFTQDETDFYAERLADLVDGSLADERWWRAEPDDEVVAAFLDPLPAATAASYLDLEYVRSDAPVAQFVVSVFADDAQPLGAPRIVKGAWDVGTGVRDDGSTFQSVRLQALALYRVGPEDDERAVLVRRELSLSGSQPFDPSSWPGFANFTTVLGVETCELYRDGVYLPIARPGPDVPAYEAFLADARDPDYVPIEEADDPDRPSPDDSRDQACADRQAS